MGLGRKKRRVDLGMKSVIVSQCHDGYRQQSMTRRFSPNGCGHVDRRSSLILLDLLVNGAVAKTRIERHKPEVADVRDDALAGEGFRLEVCLDFPLVLIVDRIKLNWPASTQGSNPSQRTQQDGCLDDVWHCTNNLEFAVAVPR